MISKCWRLRKHSAELSVGACRFSPELSRSRILKRLKWKLGYCHFSTSRPMSLYHCSCSLVGLQSCSSLTLRDCLKRRLGRMTRKAYWRGRALEGYKNRSKYNFKWRCPSARKYLCSGRWLCRYFGWCCWCMHIWTDR